MLHQLGRDGRKDLALDYGGDGFAKRRGIKAPTRSAPERGQTQGQIRVAQEQQRRDQQRQGHQRGRGMGFER